MNREEMIGAGAGTVIDRVMAMAVAVRGRGRDKQEAR
jgi:hypothetical protein